MAQTSTIEHKGIITEINESSIIVELTVLSACATCHSKSLCSLDSSQKHVEVKNEGFKYEIGEVVKVNMQESLGKKALFLGYILPFIVVLFSLILFTNLGLSEGIAGLLSLAGLIPYYATIYFLKDKIKKKFNFKIEKI